MGRGLKQIKSCAAARDQETLSRFAHMSDVHLGAHREPALRDLEQRCFGEAIDKCIEDGVDFLLVSGDLFHVGVPDLSVVNQAVRKMKEMCDAKIPIYAIYGSHDYTPNGTSIIDILQTAGILTNIMRPSLEGGRLRLRMFTDPETGARLTGISARKIGLESRSFEILDRDELERERGFKVFAFHSGITQFKPDYLSEMETIDISSLPKGFAYYAGGHIHVRGEYHLPGYDRVVFPGPLFTGYGGRDIEDTARGEKRGFYEIDFDDRLRHMRFVPVDSFPGAYLQLDMTGKNVVQANNELNERVGRLDVKGKVVVVRALGELAGGRTSEVGFQEAKKRMMDGGATWVHVNRYGLTSKEFSKAKVAGDDPVTIEKHLFEQNLGRLKMSAAGLTGEAGVMRAVEMLRLLRQPQKANELKRDYAKRMVDAGVETLAAKEIFEGERT